MNTLQKLMLLGVVGKSGGSAATPWYLAGSVPAANCLAAYQPIGALSQAASYVNKVTPGTHDAIQFSAPTAPTWNATDGWVFSGRYLLTDLTPETGWSAICRFTGATTAADFMMFGEFTNGAAFGIIPNRVTVGIRYYSGGSLDKSPGVDNGILAVAGNKAYINGVAETGTIGAWSASAGAVIYMGGQSSGILRPVNIQALSIYNATLTPTQVAAITSAMAALPL